MGVLRGFQEEGGCHKGESQVGQSEWSQRRKCQLNIFQGDSNGIMARKNTKGNCQKVGLQYTKRGNAEGSQGGHGGVLS